MRGDELGIRNYEINPVRDYRSVENRRLAASHAVRYATQYGCIPYGMLRLGGIQFTTGRYIPTECFSNYIFIPGDTFLTECETKQ